jgi:hypothetical protein
VGLDGGVCAVSGPEQDTQASTFAAWSSLSVRVTVVGTGGREPRSGDSRPDGAAGQASRRAERVSSAPASVRAAPQTTNSSTSTPV